MDGLQRSPTVDVSGGRGGGMDGKEQSVLDAIVRLRREDRAYQAKNFAMDTRLVHNDLGTSYDTHALAP